MSSSLIPVGSPPGSSGGLSPLTPAGSSRCTRGRAPAGSTRCSVNAKRVYLAVAACAVVVYLGALWNRFAMDDLYIIAFNPLVRRASGVWQVFGAPYWPPSYGGKMYRPLVIASFGLDRFIGPVAWFHAVNLIWHAA